MSLRRNGTYSSRFMQRGATAITCGHQSTDSGAPRAATCSTNPRHLWPYRWSLSGPVRRALRVRACRRACTEVIATQPVGKPPGSRTLPGPSFETTSAILTLGCTSAILATLLWRANTSSTRASITRDAVTTCIARCANGSFAALVVARTWQLEREVVRDLEIFR